MQSFFLQLLKIWRHTNSIQKMTAILILCSIGGALLYFPLKRASSNSYIPLFKNALTATDVGAVKNYLEHFSIPFKEVKDKGIFVPEENADKIRMELLEANIPKQGQAKGFELFDTNTWIKGEKELQVLEMRALKGQLEKDLSGFDQIKSASVILDIPPQRSFSNTQYKTKASCILTLMPGAKLSNSQLIAVTNHLAGAVRGLEPNMIAISDTTGKLYKAIDYTAKDVDGTNFLLLEDEAREKIGQFLEKVFGKERYLTSISALCDAKNEKSLSVGVIIDENFLFEKNLEKSAFREEILLQLTHLAKGFGAHLELSLDFAPFEKKMVAVPIVEKSENAVGLLITFGVIFLALFWAFFLFKTKEPKEKIEEKLSDALTKVDLKKLVESMKHENPKTIAMMISYLEPRKAERLIAAFPEKLQEAILIELEKEEI